MKSNKAESSNDVRKRKRVIPTREAGSPAYENPADELFAAAFAHRNSPEEPKSDVAKMPSSSKKDHLDHLDHLDGLKKEPIQYPLSPARDFAKLPNSIRRAVEKGQLQGCSLQIYLFLYSLTRGAIKPKRSVRVTKPKIKAGANIGSDVTLNKHLERLKNSGFVEITEIRGQYLGNEYKVLVPEEMLDSLDALEGLEHLESLARLTTQQLEGLDRLENRPSIPSQAIEKKDVYGFAKTSLKDKETETVDDEAYAGMLVVLTAAVERISGVRPTAKQKDDWVKFAELIVSELETAATRTRTISNIPAFLTEHLRRQLFVSRHRTIVSKKGRTDNVNSSQVGPYEIKSLNMKEKMETLVQIREFADEEFLEEFRKWYTEEDWNWLMEELRNKV